MTSLFNTRVRGFRVMEIGALSILLVLVVGLYLSKTGAGRERSEIGDTEQQIVAEQARISLLRAEVAHLEAPDRIADLAGRHLGIGPVALGHEISPDQLQTVALGEAAPATTPSTAPAPVVASAQGARQ